MIRSVRKAPIPGKRVLLRVDFNVPLHAGKVVDDSRIRAALPTIKLILSKKPEQLLIMSHLGRPDGSVVESLRLSPVAKRLSSLLNKKVDAVSECLDVRSDSQIVLLENLRFHKEEELDDAGFAKKLAKQGDIYVNDAFGTTHRAHASVHAITRYLPSYAGLLLDSEQSALSKAVSGLKRPYLAIIGGGKADKISLVSALLKRVDKMFVAGVIGNTILCARGIPIGRSKTDQNAILLARKFARDKKMMLPVDLVVSKRIDAKSKIRTCGLLGVRPDEMILDIGPESIRRLEEAISKSKTIFWAGPCGAYEITRFSRGSKAIALALAKSKGATIVGGGDSATIIHKLHLEKKITHISTGGGASIEYLEGKKLPGIEALR